MTLGSPRIHVTECESTQLLLEPSLPEGAVATADHQTGGRGRRGRTWEDAPGTALLCSVLLKPPNVRRAPELALVAGLAVAETVELELGTAAELKWPNDVLVAGQKVAGGLAELRGGAVVLGLGVNVNQTDAQLPPDARIPAASLRTVDGRERDLETLLGALLQTLDGLYATWRAAGLPSLHAHISERDFLRGRRVAVDGVEGIARGILSDGRLEVSTSGGVVVVRSGEVQFF